MTLPLNTGMATGLQSGTMRPTLAKHLPLLPDGPDAAFREIDADARAAQERNRLKKKGSAAQQAAQSAVF